MLGSDCTQRLQICFPINTLITCFKDCLYYNPQDKVLSKANIKQVRGE